ncbi:hypothetical protein GLOIN_2v1488090 [Rhizophagus clarus]|uniref:C2H2-type domain-containing protein n=1 Tax=Rhizophagus clarus TaxID=94130 RepID=A0A8H3QQZ5_9GLOM|nr:hypothetical protein GLOIN_2v1488090 [Rhizophagus clarus]
MTFYCNICFKLFATIQALKSHEQIIDVGEKNVINHEFSNIQEIIDVEEKDEFYILNSLKDDEIPSLNNLMDTEYNDNDSFQEENFSGNNQITSNLSATVIISPSTQEFDDALYKFPIDIFQILTFSNEAYSDYVDLLIRFNVPNSLGDAIIQLFNKHSLRSDSPLPKNAYQARKYIDNLHNPNSSYKRIKVCHYNDIDYYFEFCGIFYAVNKILSNADNASSCVFKFNPEFIVDEDGTEHCILNTIWMHQLLTLMEHSNSHPIYLFLVNIPMKRRTKYEAKVFIGYLPIVQANSEGQKNGVHIYINEQIEWCYMTIANIIGDLPEITSYCLTSKSPKTVMPDHMHHCDLGLFQYQLKFTRALLKLYGGQNLVDKMDNRYKSIARFSGLKLWKKGIGTIAKFTAADYRQLMQITIFVIDGLLEDRNKLIDKKLVNCYVKWNEMYKISCLNSFTEIILREFDDIKKEWAKDFISLFKTLSESNLRFVKLHSWYYHTTDAIKEFGALNGMCTETYESLHKFYVKQPYRLSNKRNVTE